VSKTILSVTVQQRVEVRITVENPVSQVAGLAGIGGIHEPLFQFVTKLSNDGVDEWLKR
jgi:hypothetical protein